MEFKNTKPTAAEFFRKYSDIVAEAEKGEPKKDEKITKVEKEKEKKADKKTLKEASTPTKWEEMMGVTPQQLQEKYEGFAAVEKSVSHNPKVRNPGAVAASIGRKKYGKGKFQKMAAAGKQEEGCMDEARGTEQERGLEKLQFGKKKPKPTAQEKGLEKLQFGKKKKKDEGCMDESQVNEKWGGDTKLNPKKKGMFKGKTKGELEKQEKALVKSGPHPKGSAANTKEHELNFAIRAKGGWPKGKSKE